MSIQSRRQMGPDDSLTVADAMVPVEYQVADDSTVDRVNDIFRSAHVLYLLVRGADGRCAGLVTRAALHPFLASSWYTERTALRDTAYQRGPFAPASLALSVAADTMRTRRLTVWPVVDDDGFGLGVLTADGVARLRSATAAV